jgi:hypothetical protein
MTITEAHPYHGITEAGRESLDRGGNADVWIEYDSNCPICRENRRRAQEAHNK